MTEQAPIIFPLVYHGVDTQQTLQRKANQAGDRCAFRTQHSRVRRRWNVTVSRAVPYYHRGNSWFFDKCTDLANQLTANYVLCLLLELKINILGGLKI